MDKEDILIERINYLIENELLSVNVLQEATGIEKDRLESFLTKKNSKLSDDSMEHSQRKLRLFRISDCLIDGMKVSEDERDKGVIDVLMQVYGMDIKMISCYTHIKEQEILDFMNDLNQMTYEEKYRLAVKIFSLLQVMKDM